MKTSKKYFPCPICKGKGEFLEDIIDYHRITTECGWCEGEGMVEKGGKIHRERKAEQLALEIIKFVNPAKDEWSWVELKEIGEKALSLV